MVINKLDIKSVIQITFKYTVQWQHCIHIVLLPPSHPSLELSPIFPNTNTVSTNSILSPPHPQTLGSLPTFAYCKLHGCKHNITVKNPPQNPVFPFGYISRSRVAGSSYILFLRAPAIHFNVPFLCLISPKGREKKMYQYHHVGGHAEPKYYLRSLSLGNNLSKLPNVSVDQFVYF